MTQLDGAVAIVTGAAQGLGFAIARQLAADGAAVLMTDRQGDKVEAATAEIASQGGEVLALRVDASVTADAERMAATAIEAFGGIDFLVNAAGGSGDVGVIDIEDVSEELWDTVVGSNLKGTYVCSRAVVPDMRRRGGGRIVNFSSGVASGAGGPLGTVAVRLAYASAKSGIEGFTRQLAKDLMPAAIKVNTLRPGFVMTEQGARVYDRFQDMTEEERTAMLARIPGGPRQPEDAGWAVRFLLLPETGYLTGQLISVQGPIHGRKLVFQGGGILTAAD